MACSCRGSGAGVVITGENGVNVTGAGTQQRPFRISTSLADSLVFEVRDSSTVNLTITGSGSVEDPYILRADTGSVTALTSLSDVISDAPQAGAVPTWVAASNTIPAHWEFQVPEVADNSSVPTSILTGTIADANLPDRLDSTSGFLAAGTDLNTIYASGIYRGTQLVNAPPVNPSAWYWIEVMNHDSTNTWALQNAYSYAPVAADQPAQMYQRRKIGNGTWSAWTRMYTEADIAAGALNAYYSSKQKTGSILQEMLPFADVSGKVNIAVTTAAGGGYQGTRAVVFPAGRFDDPPQVQLTAEDSTAGSMKLSVVPGSVTTSGFTAYCWRSAANSALPFNYYARDSRNS